MAVTSEYEGDGDLQVILGNLTGSNDNQTISEPNNVLTTLKAIQSLIFVFALGGNLITLGALMLYRKRRRKFSRMNLFIMHLCIADIAVAIFNVAPNLCFLVSYPEVCPIQNTHGKCKAVNYFSLVAIYGSTYVLVMTAVDRFIAICYPFAAQRLTSLHVHIMIALAWTLSFIFSIPQLLIFDFDETKNMCNAEWHSIPEKHDYYSDIYMAWFACAVWIFPIIIIAICYISITAVVWNRSSALSRRSTFSNKGSSRSKMPLDARSTSQLKMMKPVRLTLAVIIGYLLCWSPWMISMMLIRYRKERQQQLSPTGYMVIELLTYLIGLNSCLNPWLYLCFNCGSLKANRRRGTRYTTCTTHIPPDTGGTIRQSVTSDSATIRLNSNNNKMSLDKISNL